MLIFLELCYTRMFYEQIGFYIRFQAILLSKKDSESQNIK